MMLSIIIVNWNTSDLLCACIRSIALEHHPDWEMIVVDNASSDGSQDRVAATFPFVHLICNECNLGFAAANNQGIRSSRGDFVLLLNSDTEVQPGAIETLLSFMIANPGVGVVGPRLLQPDGTAQPFAFGGDPTLRYLLKRGFCAKVRGQSLHDWATDKTQAVDWISGAALLARRTAIDQVELLDEQIFMYFEDVDWCLRFRRSGWAVYYLPTAQVLHRGGQSVAQNPAAQAAYRQSLRYFYSKHYARYAQIALRFLLPVYGALH